MRGYLRTIKANNKALTSSYIIMIWQFCQPHQQSMFPSHTLPLPSSHPAFQLASIHALYASLFKHDTTRRDQINEGSFYSVFIFAVRNCESSWKFGNFLQLDNSGTIVFRIFWPGLLLFLSLFYNTKPQYIWFWNDLSCYFKLSPQCKHRAANQYENYPPVPA